MAQKAMISKMPIHWPGAAISSARLIMAARVFSNAEQCVPSATAGISSTHELAQSMYVERGTFAKGVSTSAATAGFELEASSSSPLRVELDDRELLLLGLLLEVLLLVVLLLSLLLERSGSFSSATAEDDVAPGSFVPAWPHSPSSARCTFCLSVWRHTFSP